MPFLRHSCCLFQISHCDAKHIRGLVTSKPTLATMSVRFSATSMKVSSAFVFMLGPVLGGIAFVSETDGTSSEPSKHWLSPHLYLILPGRAEEGKV